MRFDPRLATIVLLLLLTSCSAEVTGVPGPHPAPAAKIETGRSLIATYGCGSCHTIPGVPGADSMAASSLGRFYERSFIDGRLPNTSQNLIRWIRDPQQVDPETAMPNLGIGEEEAQDIAAFLYHQPTLRDWLKR